MIILHVILFALSITYGINLYNWIFSEKDHEIHELEKELEAERITRRAIVEWRRSGYGSAKKKT